MDYAHEDKLNKLQWDIIQEPGVTWGIFEKDEDQMAKGNTIAKYCKKINEIKVTNEFEAVSFNRNTFTEALKYASEKGIASYLPSYENIPSGLLKAYEPGNPNFNLQSVYASQTVLESFNKAGNEHILFHYYVQRLFCEENSTSVAIKPLSFNTIKDDSDKNAKVKKFIEALEGDNNTTADGSIQLNNAQVQILSDTEVMGYIAKRLTTYSPMNITTQDGSKSYADYSIVVPHTETNEFQVLVKNDENYQTYDFDLLDFHRDKSLTRLGQGVANNGKNNNYEDYEGCAILRILDTISEIHYGEGHHFYNISDNCRNINKNFNNVNGVKVDMYVEQHQISENNEEMNVTLYLDEISDNDITVELQLPLTEDNPAKHVIHTDLTGPDDYTLERQVTIPAGTQ